MAHPRLECAVLFQTDSVKIGEYANAFRVMEHTAEEVFLDFCVFSAPESVAKVVSRVRIHRSFLPLMHERLQESLTEISGTTRQVSFRAGLLVTPEGSIFLPVDSGAES
jgi:hypothetical protein